VPKALPEVTLRLISSIQVIVAGTGNLQAADRA
jgi:hypothetical protein